MLGVSARSTSSADSLVLNERRYKTFLGSDSSARGVWTTHTGGSAQGQVAAAGESAGSG